MIDPITAVETFLANGQVIQTRLRERATDEVLDLLPMQQPAIPDVSLTDIVAALVMLERRGVVRRVSEKVCAQDSTEYVVTWCRA
jgi:hypothetical protein